MTLCLSGVEIPMSDKFQWGEAGKLIPAADEAVPLQSCREKLPRLVAPFNQARQTLAGRGTLASKIHLKPT
jgi:hypothetical protein